MELYVIRHGQSEANVSREHAGWAPTPLTEKGREQARGAGERLKGIEFEKVYVSDLLRTRQTAELVLPGREYLLDERIREVNVGELAGKRIEDCKATMGETYWNSLTFQNYIRYGGESIGMVYERVSRFMKDMEREGAEGRERIAVVTHEGAIQCMLRYVLQSNFHKSHVRIGNCSITLLEYTNGNWRLWVSGIGC